MPGEEVVLRAHKTVEEEMRDVGKFDWFSVRPPSVEDLRKFRQSQE